MYIIRVNPRLLPRAVCARPEKRCVLSVYIYIYIYIYIYLIYIYMFSAYHIYVYTYHII